jgi:hypothetical protein
VRVFLLLPRVHLRLRRGEDRQIRHFHSALGDDVPDGPAADPQAIQIDGPVRKPARRSRRKGRALHFLTKRAHLSQDALAGFLREEWQRDCDQRGRNQQRPHVSLRKLGLARPDRR